MSAIVPRVSGALAGGGATLDECPPLQAAATNAAATSTGRFRACLNMGFSLSPVARVQFDAPAYGVRRYGNCVSKLADEIGAPSVNGACPTGASPGLHRPRSVLDPPIISG